MKKFKKVLAAVLAGTMVVASMVCSAFATGDFKTTGTSVTLDDGGIRINIYNPRMTHMQLIQWQMLTELRQ